MNSGTSHNCYSCFRKNFYAKYTAHIFFIHPTFASCIQASDVLSVSDLTDDSRVRVTLCKYIINIAKLALKITMSMKYKSTFTSLGGGPGCGIMGSET